MGNWGECCKSSLDHPAIIITTTTSRRKRSKLYHWCCLLLSLNLSLSLCVSNQLPFLRNGKRGQSWAANWNALIRVSKLQTLLQLPRVCQPERTAEGVCPVADYGNEHELLLLPKLLMLMMVIVMVMVVVMMAINHSRRCLVSRKRLTDMLAAARLRFHHHHHHRPRQIESVPSTFSSFSSYFCTFSDEYFLLVVVALAVVAPIRRHRLTSAWRPLNLAFFTFAFFRLLASLSQVCCCCCCFCLFALFLLLPCIACICPLSGRKGRKRRSCLWLVGWLATRRQQQL